MSFRDDQGCVDASIRVVLTDVDDSAVCILGGIAEAVK